MKNDEKILKSYSVSLLFMAFIGFMVFTISILVLCGVIKQGQLAQYNLDIDGDKIVVIGIGYLIQGLINSYLGLSGINQVNKTNKNYIHIKLSIMVIVLYAIAFAVNIYKMFKGEASSFELIYQIGMVVFTSIYYAECKKVKGG